MGYEKDTKSQCCISVKRKALFTQYSTEMHLWDKLSKGVPDVLH